jgi:hypothetical protein
MSGSSNADITDDVLRRFRGASTTDEARRLLGRHAELLSDEAGFRASLGAALVSYGEPDALSQTMTERAQLLQECRQTYYRISSNPHPLRAAVAVGLRSVRSLKEFPIARRLSAATLTAVSFLMVFFSLQVLRHIWPGLDEFLQAPSSLVKSTSLVVPTAVLWAAIVGLAGQLARILPWLAVLNALVLGVLPLTLPYLVSAGIPRSPGMYDFLNNALAGMDRRIAIFALAVCAPLALWLTSRVNAVIPAPSIALIASRAVMRTGLSSTDRKVLKLGIILIAAMVPAWLIGRFLLQDRILFKAGAGVFDVAGRQFWPYAVPLWVGGAIVILLSMAAVLVLNVRWRGRYIAPLVGALIVMLALFVLRPIATQLWSAAESKTAVELIQTAYPFSDHFATCGSVSTTLTGKNKKKALWQVHTTRTPGHTGGCNRLVIYKGWRRMGNFDLPRGREIKSTPKISKVSTTAKARVTVKLKKGKSIEVALRKFDK